MRIFGSAALAMPSTPAAVRRAAGGGFTVSDSEGAATPHATPLRAVGTIDALVALQGQDDRPERRRRAVAHGRQALDALDALKAELLTGSLGAAAISRIKAAGVTLSELSGDAGLDDVIAQIDLRVAVEIAKFTAVQNAA